MLNRRGNHMLFRSVARPNCSQNREIVGLGTAAQEDQILGVRAEQSGYLAARDFELLLGNLAVVMNTGRVSIHFK